MGATLAVAFAVQFPDKVQSLVLINPPMIASKDEFEKTYENTQTGLMSALTLNQSIGRIVCFIHELFPPLFYPIIRFLQPEIPSDIAWDITKHTWDSSDGSLKNTILRENIFLLLHKVEVPVLIIASNQDSYSKRKDFDGIANDKIQVHVVDGTHNFILTNHREALKLVTNFFSHNE
jgi:pimeloyl-ACP methyl ester carboxylesterase